MILKGETSVKITSFDSPRLPGYHPLRLRSSEKRKELAQIVHGFGGVNIRLTSFSPRI